MDIILLQDSWENNKQEILLYNNGVEEFGVPLNSTFENMDNVASTNGIRIDSTTKNNIIFEVNLIPSEDIILTIKIKN